METSWKKKKKRSILIRCLLIIIGFILLEIFTRYIYDERAEYGSHSFLFFRDKLNLSMSYMKNKFFNEENGLICNIDDKKPASYYLRHYSDDKEKTILVLGDSFTLGSGLESRNNTYWRYWTNDYNIIVLADGGLNIEQKYSLLKEIGLKYNPDIVILQSTPIDISPKKTPLGENVNGRFYIYSRTDLIYVDDLIIPSLPGIPKKLSEILFRVSVFSRYVSFRLNLINHQESSSIERGTQTIKQFRNIVTDHGTKLIIAYFPTSSEGTCFTEYSKIISSIEDSVNLCDFLDPMKVKSMIEPPENGHYNAEGQRIAADEILKVIKKDLSG